MNDIKNCTRCPRLVKARRQVVCGEGPVPCDMMVIARNPGKVEDKYGRPLIATAGETELWALNRGTGRNRENVYLTNAVKCYTPNDKPPNPIELENCREYLVDEIDAVHPRVIIATGREAVSWFAPYLANEYTNIKTAVLGPVSDIRGIPFRVQIRGNRYIVVPTFHPSFVSRTQHITKKNAKKKIYNAKPVAIRDHAIAKEILNHGWTDRLPRAEVFVETIRENDENGQFSVDLETTGLSHRTDKILGYAIATSGDVGQSSTNVDWLKRALESNRAKIVQNGAFDFRFAFANKINVNIDPNRDFDTMFAAHALAPDLPVNLGFINSLYVHIPPWKTKTKGKMHDTEKMDQRELHERCCYDAVATYKAAQVLKNDLKEAGLYESPFRRLYMPMLPVLIDMQMTGVKFDMRRCNFLIVKLQPQYTELKDKWWNEYKLNIGSTKQIAPFLAEKGAVEVKYTAKGSLQVTDDMLERSSHPLALEVRRYRALQKLLGTDLVGIRNRVTSDSRVFSDFDLTGTGTGRFSSSVPDMQNIRLLLRDMYVADKGHYLFGADYEGMELYVAALLAEDYELVEELKAGRDPHEEKRREIFGLQRPNNDIIYKAQRRTAKIYNFGPLYGKTKYGLARDLHVTQAEAERFLSTSVTQRPKFVNWRALQAELAYGSGAVYSAFGRRRLLFADRIDTQAYNSPVQMTAHDIVLETMILVYNELKLVPWVQSHDFIAWQIPGKLEAPNIELESKIEEIMTRQIAELNNHRFTVDSGRGYNWKQIDVGVEDVE